MSVIFLLVFVCNFSIPDWSITIFLDPTLLASDNVTGSKFSKSTYSVATVSNQTMTHEQQHAFASSLSQLLVPEISQQISQAIATLERSPSNVATPQ
jgi:hypothetical protein